MSLARPKLRVRLQPTRLNSSPSVARNPTPRPRPADHRRIGTDTSQALAALLRANIPVNLLGWNGQFLGGLLPAQNAHGLARMRQYQKTQETGFPLPWPDGLLRPNFTTSGASCSGWATRNCDRVQLVKPGNRRERMGGGQSPLPLRVRRVPGTARNPTSRFRYTIGAHQSAAPLKLQRWGSVARRRSYG